MNVYKYSLLRYKPSILREEFINIGLVFHSPKHSFLDIKLTKEWNRVQVFAGGANIEDLKSSAEGLFDLINRSQLLKLKEYNIQEENLLENITKSLSGQLFFSSVRRIEAKNSPFYTFKYLFEINVSIKSIPRYDHKEQFNIKKAVKDIFKDVTNLSISNNNHIQGVFESDILEYDLVTKDSLYKSISFLNKDMRKLKQTIKALAFDSEELKKTKGYQTYLIYVNDDNEFDYNDVTIMKERMKKVYEISKKEELLIKIKELDNQIDNIKIQNNYFEEYLRILKRKGIQLINLHDFESFIQKNRSEIVDNLLSYDDFLKDSFHM